MHSDEIPPRTQTLIKVCRSHLLNLNYHGAGYWLAKQFNTRLKHTSCYCRSPHYYIESSWSYEARKKEATLKEQKFRKLTWIWWLLDFYGFESSSLKYLSNGTKFCLPIFISRNKISTVLSSSVLSKHSG